MNLIHLIFADLSSKLLWLHFQVAIKHIARSRVTEWVEVSFQFLQLKVVIVLLKI